MNAVLKTAPSSNLKALQNFRYTPLAKIAGLVAAPAVSDEEIARRRAEDAERKAAKAKAKADAKAAKAARAKPLPPQPRMVIPPQPETVEMIERQRRAKAERAEHAAKTAPIPEEILRKGLEADLAEEAKRREEEAAEAKLFAEGYKRDVHASAMSIIFNNEMPLEGKVISLEELGFMYSHDHNNGRDAFYRHSKSEVEVRINGGAIGQGTRVNGYHKPRGVELLTPEKIAERQAANAKLREEGRMKRKSRGTVVKTPKADKKAKGKKGDDDKKAKRGGKQ